MVNHFATSGAAERYARGRPFFHPQVADRIRARTGCVDLALDVACGTGQSSIALAALAKRVLAVDLAAAMIAYRARHPAVSYALASAEQLPLGDATIDLLTVWSAFHWFERDAFLREAKRALRPHGWLIITQDGFSGMAHGCEAFAAWNRDEYHPRYPSPPRRSPALSHDDAARAGLVLIASETYARDQVFGEEALVDYLMTQSNVAAAIDRGDETEDGTRAWLHSRTGPFFAGGSLRFGFGGRLWFARAS